MAILVRNNPLALVDPMGLCHMGADNVAYDDEPGDCGGGSVTVTASAPPDVMPIFVSLPSLLSDNQQPAPTAPPPTVREAGVTFRWPQTMGSLLTRVKAAVCSAIPQGRVTTISGSLGLFGGQTGSLSVVINYNNGQVSGFATGGLQAGWNGAAAASVSTGFVYGNLRPNNSGFSGDFVTGYGSGPVFGGYGSFGNGISVFGVSAGANLTGGAGGGANFTKTTNPHQFSLAVGSLFTTPLDNALSFARGLVCHQ